MYQLQIDGKLLELDFCDLDDVAIWAKIALSADAGFAIIWYRVNALLHIVETLYSG